MTTYYTPTGGLPPQTDLLTDRAVFTIAYAVIPKGTLRDITTSLLPGWDKMRMWVIARPMTGFSETFSHYIAEVAPGGGSTTPETDATAQAVLFVVAGHAELTVQGTTHLLYPGSYAYLPAGCDWTFANDHDAPCTFHWIRKAYVPAPGIAAPAPFVTQDGDAPVIEMPGTNGAWSTTRFVSPTDLAHDMHVNIVNFQPGGTIPFPETHVMEHGLYVLEGKAVYRLNSDWVEVEAGDYMWLRAFCPQARYLLYKDVNRHMPLSVR